MGNGSKWHSSWIFLRPTFILIVHNDLASIDNLSLELFLFADDAYLFRYISKQSDSSDLQTDLNELYEWTSKSLLTLDVSKCKVVSYGRNKSFDRKFNENEIESLEKAEKLKDQL